MLNKVFSFRTILILTIVYLLIAFILYPLGQLVFSGESFGPMVRIGMKQQTLIACFNSILLSVATVAGSAVIGTYLAYTLQYKKIWLKKIFSVVVLLPIAIPPIVGTMSYLFLLEDNGMVMKILGLTHFDFTGWKAILIIHLYSFYPLFYLFVGNALKTIDASIIEASFLSGATKWQTFYKIVLPQLKVSLLGASMLVFMASMASFSAPFIFAGATRFLTTEIYYAKVNGDYALSASYSLLLTFISITVLFIFNYFNKKIPAAAKTKGTIKQSEILLFAKTSRLDSIMMSLFGFFVILPLLSLILISLLPDNSLMTNRWPSHFGFSNYNNLFSKEDFNDPFINSALSSVIAVFITIILGMCIAHIIRGKKNIFKTVIEIVASIPYGIPGTVIGLCLILSFNEPSFFSLNTVLVGSFWILPIAYVIRNLPIMTQAAKVGLHAVDVSIEEASQTLGASTYKTWRSITMPLIFPFIVEGALLVFINAFGEFVATVLLYNYNTRTIPIEIFSQIRLDNNGTAAAYGVVLFLIVMFVIFLSRKLAKKY